MGWDITYHPLAAHEAQDVYFRCLDDANHYRDIARQYGLDEDAKASLTKLIDQVRRSIEDAAENPPARWHMYVLAAIAGYLRPYWYLRGSAISFLDDALLGRYIAPWSGLIPADRVSGAMDNALTENYAGGVFLPPESLLRLRSDYEKDGELRAAMNALFSHGRLEVFWKAVGFAIEHSLGLLEAAEIEEPSPFDPEGGHSRTWYPNCKPEGVVLFHQAAMEQIQAVSDRNDATQR